MREKYRECLVRISVRLIFHHSRARTEPSRYLATGDSFKTISFSYRMGHSTVQSIVTETCRAIVEGLMSEVMPEPSEEDWKRISQDFKGYWNFPNCIGAVDGKHVSIQAPPKSGSQFFNYKKIFSVVLLGLFDANYNFIAVDVGAYGKSSDGGIWARSNIGKAFESGNFSVPGPVLLPGTSIELPHIIVADEAFQLKPYIMRPYPGQELDNPKRIFNYRLSRARRVSENGFGILVQKFRLYNRRIQSLPANVDNIILSTCVLHNFIRKYERYEGTPVISGETSSNEYRPVNSALRNLSHKGGNATKHAFQIRDAFKDYFASEAGSVPWQNQAISGRDQ
ncbi:protein ANTAGONIST OF LIKE HETEROCHROMATIN PROTEIN 1-like isoform X2 [Cimex lectularius]|uniref:DDE Tnp4 domain-containing protein n=1 Tax=Cimex lectularius TaxID=79782 RepID=A0A8I6SQG4_CIMLE|nr:protein ANTAGONIST OF LIKE HETEROCHROMATIN PROTEIN 1-like isoform X2 [Cimex lectularius]